MKKTLIASSIITALTATSAFAATIAEKDGFKYELNGDLQVQLQKDNGDDKHLYVNFDDVEFDNKISYQLDDHLTALGRIKFDFKDSANDKKGKTSDLDEAFLGFKYHNTTATIGKQDYATDHFGIAEDYEMSSDDVAFDKTKGDDVLALDIDLNRLNIVLSTELRAEEEDSEDEQSFDLFASYGTDVFELAVAYQKREQSLHGDEKHAYGISAAFDAGFATFAADYSEAEDELEVYNVVSLFDVADRTRMAIGFVNNKPTDDKETNEWYANVTYRFNKFSNVRIFGELSSSDADDSELGYMMGTRIKF